MAGTTPTTAHPTTERRPESRFTFGLILDVAKVLEAHGYERLDGPQFVELQQHFVRPAAWRCRRPLHRPDPRRDRGGGPMTFDTIPGDGPALMRVLHQHHLSQVHEATVARHRHRLVTAAGIDPGQLSQRGQRTLAELCAIDELVIDGLVEILFATRTAALMPTEPDRPVHTQPGTEAAVAQVDDQGEARRDRR